jgi:dihydroorotate dehydrogenase
MFYKFFRPLVFKLDSELAHNLAIKFLRFFPNLATLFCLKKEYANLRVKLWNIDFANPIGMSAGFDKNAETAATLARFGFGFVEVGTVTPKAQIGNEKPRMFRLAKDLAIINRLGFNNSGAEVFARNIVEAKSKIAAHFPLGINIGKNKDTVDAVADYLLLMEKFHNQASYITINISSPNTKNLRDLQEKENLAKFLSEIMTKKSALKMTAPVLLKVAPDLTFEQQQDIAEIALDQKIDGLIISNTTISREFNLQSLSASESGGLSGKPLFEKSNEVLGNFYRLTNGKIPLIGVGGIFSAADAYKKIRLGASLVQIYSAFIYEGFGLVEKIKADLTSILAKDGFNNIRDAVGIDCKSN